MTKKQDYSFLPYLERLDFDKAQQLYGQGVGELTKRKDLLRRKGQLVSAQGTLAQREALEVEFEDLQHEQAAYDDAYQNGLKIAALRELEQQGEIMSGLKAELRQYDEAALVALMQAYQAISARMACEIKRHATQQRLARHSRKFGQSPIAESGGVKTCYGQKLNVQGLQDAAGQAFAHYAWRFGAKPTVDLEDFIKG